MDISDVDLTDLDLFGRGDAYAAFTLLRGQPGLYWNVERDGPGFWAVTRYRDAAAVYKDTVRFTSTCGTILGPNRNRPDPAGGRMLVMTDPPRHVKLRQILNRAFTPRMMQRLHAHVMASVTEVVSEALERGQCDFVADISSRVPVASICELMGIPRQDWSSMYELTSTAFSFGDPEYELSSSGRFSAASAHSDILDYCANLLAVRRRSPGDDLVSLLAMATIDGVPLSDEEVLLDCDNLIVGGNETTRHAAAGGVLALVHHGDQFRRLQGDRRLLDSTVEEILRWTSPGMHVLRTCIAETVVGGQTVRPGEQVTVWNISANRDENVFPQADTFDITRRPNQHLALGQGEHYCLGAALTRLELHALFERLLTQVSRIELAGPVEPIRSNVVSGLKRLPVVLHPL